MRDLRTQRTSSLKGSLADRALARIAAKRAAEQTAAAPLYTASGYDRRAIMTAAWAAARVARLHGSHESWQVLVGRTLQDLWRFARAQKAAGR
jgi:hypothetical protein